jgi:hypothetical protein
VATLTFYATHHLGDGGVVDSAGLHLDTPSGDHLTLTRALVTVSSVEIFPCASATGQWLKWLSPVGSAWAHGITTPRYMGTPNVIDLTAGEGQLLSLGQLLPDMGSACRARVKYAPIDQDGAVASGFPEMKGYSLALTGELLRAGWSSPISFSATSVRVEGVELELPQVSFKAGAAVSLTFELPVSAWFADLDVTSDGGVDQVLARAAATTTLQP